jgi:tetratricopeptide (TPR) repeat protein
MSSQVFVSYAHVDDYFVPALKERLHDYFDLWIDAANLAAGRNWRDEIDRAIKESFAVLVIITPESCESKYVTYEWSYALGLGTPVIPLLLEDSGDKIHPRLNAIQYFDFTQRFKEPWNELIDRLKVTQNEAPSTAATEASLRLMQLAQDQYDHNDLHNALDTLNEALRLARTSLLDDVHYQFALVYLKLDDLDSAESHLTKLLQLNPTHVRGLVASGDLYRMRADRAAEANERVLWLTKAEAQFRAALKERDDLLDSSGESVWASLGGILKRKNEIDAAIDAYKKAARIKRSSYPYTNLGILFMQKNDFAHMRESFGLVELFAQSKVNQNPGDEWAHNDLFTAQIVLGKLDDARTSLARVKVVAPAPAIESLRRTLAGLLQVAGVPETTRTFISEADQELAAQLAYLAASE